MNLPFSFLLALCVKYKSSISVGLSWLSPIKNLKLNQGTSPARVRKKRLMKQPPVIVIIIHFIMYRNLKSSPPRPLPPINSFPFKFNRGLQIRIRIMGSPYRHCQLQRVDPPSGFHICRYLQILRCSLGPLLRLGGFPHTVALHPLASRRMVPGMWARTRSRLSRRCEPWHWNQGKYAWLKIRHFKIRSHHGRKKTLKIYKA